MGDELKWIIGLGVTLWIFAFGAISTSLYRTNRAMKEGDDKLHERINKVRDEYVKRVDLDGHLQRMDKKLDEISADQKAMQTAVLQALGDRRRTG